MSASIYLPSRIAQHLEYHPVLGVGVMQLEPFSLWNCPAHAATLVEAPQEREDRSDRRRLSRVLDDGLDAGATLADTFGDPTAVAYTGLTLTAATFDHKLMLVEFDCDTMTTTNRFLVWAVSATANPMDLSCVMIGKPRYPGHTGVTAL